MPALVLALPAVALVTPAKIDLSQVPSHPFDAGDARLREAAALFQKALAAPTVSFPILVCPGLDSMRKLLPKGGLGFALCLTGWNLS